MVNKPGQSLVERIVRAELRQRTAYHVTDATGLVKLDAMENPYPWPHELIEPWLEDLRTVSLNRYPDSCPRSLQEAIRSVFGVTPDIDLLFGNGSDEIIQMLCLAIDSQATVMALEPSFSMYRNIAAACGRRYVAVNLQDDFSLSLETMLDAMERHQPELLFLALPNNPTANSIPHEQLDCVIRQAPGVVVVDEAYQIFADTNYLARVADYDNLLVMRTFSKMGLAGLRLGMLFGDARWLQELNKVRLPYNIGTLTQVTAAFALRNYDVFRRQAAAIRRDREELVQALNQLSEVTAYPSQANFILFRVSLGRAAEIFEQLKTEGVLIKNLDGGGTLLDNCLRVTVGTRTENKAFLAALDKAIQKAA